MLKEEVILQMDNRTKVLQLLDKKRNVILMGAPGTGKSKLINEVADAFEKNSGIIATPSHEVGATVPIPAVIKKGIETEFLKKKNRKVFRTTMHQNSKYRDFLTGIVPSITSVGGFCISEGILYRANEFAKQEDSAALLIIDELNRGPAIEVFGGSIVAIENDKRLSTSNTKIESTQTFEIICPSTGKMIDYAFSPNLYILAAMNQADVSVAPLDVAFLRRWQPYKLLPDYKVLENTFKVSLEDIAPDSPMSAQDVYLTAFRALKVINEKIVVGRGEDYQIGQGVFLSSMPKDSTMDAALEFVCEVWGMIYAHIEELFFGDVTSIAYILNSESRLSPYSTKEVNFAGEMKTILVKDEIGTSNVYNLFLAIERLI